MIEATNLANYYGRHAAVDDSSSSVKPVVGEVLGLDGVDEIADRSSSGFELGNGTPRTRVVRAAVAAGADGLTKMPGVTPPLVLVWYRWPVEWIAAHLGCRPGTVKSRHARALAKIRTGLS